MYESMYYTFILLYCAICASQDNEPSTYDTYTFTLKNKVGNFKKYIIKKIMAELEIILSFCNFIHRQMSITITEYNYSLLLSHLLLGIGVLLYLV